MGRSLANVIAVLGLTVYWTLHTVAIVTALYPIARQAQEVGVLAKDSLELPIVGIFAAPVIFLLELGPLLGSIALLFLACIGLPLAAIILGLGAGAAIRAADPYGLVSHSYVFTSSCVLAVLSLAAVVMLYPRLTTTHAMFAVPALALATFPFSAAMRFIAYRGHGEVQEANEA